LQIDYAVLAAFTLLWLAIVPTPGPNTLLIVHLAVTAAWRDVAAALAGNLLAIAFYAFATLLGLAVLLAAAPSVRLGVYLLGGAYLVWVGIGLVRAGLTRRRRAASADALSAGQADGRAGRPFLQGVLTALANVQALFFLASIFAGVGVLGASPATRLAAVGVIVAGNGSYLTVLAWLMQRERVRTLYARYRPAMEIAFGVLFVCFGARLVQRELMAWL
jgi:threonine/homoserine/homoserine lactone efflux protein